MKYLLLARHGRHESVGSTFSGRKLSPEGERETVEVANRLRSVLQELRDPSGSAVRIEAIWRADTSETLATSKVFQNALRDVIPRARLCVIDELGPQCFEPYRNTKSHEALCERLSKTVLSQVAGNAILVVGHQPLLGWMAHVLTGKSIALGHSEVACVGIEESRLRKDVGGVCCGSYLWTTRRLPRN